MKVGILHPGSMGVSVARSIREGGHDVLWASDGRSPATRERAGEHGLVDAGSLQALCDGSDVVVSICPPDAATDLARDVLETGFKGIFVDGNAISPQRMASIAEMLTPAGISVVDGGIIGPPAWKPDKTWLYLSGPDAGAIADCAGGGLLRTAVIGTEVGKASALKMCYAALSKGTTALVSAIVATADELNVKGELYQHWERDQTGLSQQREMMMRGVTAKAWRFVAEMEEISQTFEAAGVPGGFHQAAGDLYRRLAHLKDGPHPSDYDTVVAALRNPEPVDSDNH